MSASGGLTIRPLPDSIYGLAESDEELLRRLKETTSNQSSPTGNSGKKLIVSTTATYDTTSSSSSTDSSSLPPSPDVPPSFIKRGNNKSRSLSLEEIEATKAAEENVKAYIAKQKSMPPPPPPSATSSSTSTNSQLFNPLVTNINPQLKVAAANSQTTTDNPDYNLIDKLLAKSGILPKNSQVRASPPAATQQQQKSSTITAAPVKTAAAVKPPVVSAVVGSSVSNQQQKPATSTAVPPAVPLVPPSVVNKKLYVKSTNDKQMDNVASSTPSAPKPSVIKLPTTEEAVLGDSLQWLIKHRWV